MTREGWIFMICSLGFVVGLLIDCFWRVLRTRSAAGDFHAPPTIETGDEET